MAERAGEGVDVARVAKGLTKAQQTAVARGEGTGATLRRIICHEPPLFGRADFDNGYGWLQLPTDLGLAVRAFIREKGNV